MSLETDMLEIGRRAKAAAGTIANAPAATRSAAIRGIAAQLRAQARQILAANAEDVAEATGLVDRLRLDPERLEAMAASMEQIADLPDPVGTEAARWQRPNGLDIARVRTPIGVIGMIFESRPNVTADAAALCLRSGNAVILRGGSEACAPAAPSTLRSRRRSRRRGCRPTASRWCRPPDRDAVGTPCSPASTALIDLIIPRGGKGLVARVQQEARVPVLAHLEGLCHTYVHAAADPDMAVEILRQRQDAPGLGLRRDRDPADRPRGGARAAAPGRRGARRARLRAARRRASRALVPDMAAGGRGRLGDRISRADAGGRPWSTGSRRARPHRRYGSGHTDAIITEDPAAAEDFLDRVDSAIVMWNASTQFADGGEFGFGAEIGIATGRLHARGPVGPEQLTTFKYVVRGTGQVRP